MKLLIELLKFLGVCSDSSAHLFAINRVVCLIVVPGGSLGCPRLFIEYVFVVERHFRRFQAAGNQGGGGGVEYIVAKLFYPRPVAIIIKICALTFLCLRIRGLCNILSFSFPPFLSLSLSLFVSLREGERPGITHIHTITGFQVGKSKMANPHVGFLHVHYLTTWRKDQADMESTSRPHHSDFLRCISTSLVPSGRGRLSHQATLCLLALLVPPM